MSGTRASSARPFYIDLKVKRKRGVRAAASKMAIPEPQEAVEGEGEENLKCGLCKRVFATQQQLKQHQRRRTCAGNMSNAEHICSTCQRPFSKYAGLRLHIRRAHFEEYNDQMADEAEGSRKAWNEDEQRAMARMEAELNAKTATDIINHLTANTARSRDAIKKRRQRRSYIDLVQELRSELANANASVNESGSSFVGDAVVDDRHQVDDAIRRHLSSLPIDGCDKDLRTSLMSATTYGQEALDEWARALFPELCSDGNTNRNNVRRNEDENEQGLASASETKRHTRQMHKKQTGKMKNEKHKGSQKALPTAKTIRSLLEGVFSVPSLPNDTPIQDQFSTRTHVMSTVSNMEIAKAIKELSSNSQLAKDVGVQIVNGIPINRLNLLYNGMVLLEYTPKILKESRTTIIPREGATTTKDLSTWRTIPVSPPAIRVFHTILSHRLERLRLYRKERVFSERVGDLTNVPTVHTIIKIHQASCQPMCIIELDVSQAFETVSHHSLARAIRRVNLDSKFGRYISEHLNGATTCISSRTGQVELKMERGVRQDDPISPVLVNILLDELIDELDRCCGIEIGTERLCCLIYPDDIILFAKNREDAQRMIDTCYTFFLQNGMSLNTKKCRVLSLKRVPSKKKLFMETIPLLWGEFSIPAVTDEEQLKYLGAELDTPSEDSNSCSMDTPPTTSDEAGEESEEGEESEPN